MDSMNTTLITGASSGIGEAFARKLAGQGHNLLLVARSEDKLINLCNELGRINSTRAQYVAMDLSDRDAPARLFEETQQRGLEIDFLINNAGFGSMGEFTKLDLERELGMIDLNVRSLVELTHRFLVPMRERKTGSIINVASTAGFQPVPFMATYAATKAFVLSFSEALAEENRPLPGSYRNELFRGRENPASTRAHRANAGGCRRHGPASPGARQEFGNFG